MHNMTQREEALEALLTKAYTLLIMVDQIGYKAGNRAINNPD